MSNPVKIANFTPKFDSVVDDVGSGAADVFGAMWRFAQMEDNVCKASKETIGKMVGGGWQKVLRHQKELAKKGYINDLTPGVRNRPHIWAVKRMFHIVLAAEEITENEEVYQNSTPEDNEVCQNETPRYTKMVREESPLRDSTTLKEGGQKKPPPIPPTKPSPKPKKPKAKQPAACHVYRSVYSRWPPKDIWPDLDKAIGQKPDDLEKLRLVIQAWKMQSNKPHNFTGIIDWFNNGIPKYAKNGGEHGHQANGNHARETSIPGLRRQNSGAPKKCVDIGTGETYYLDQSGNRVAAPVH